MGRDGDALANYQRSIAISPTAQAYSNLGAFHHSRHDYESAIEAYRAAIKMRPNSAATHRNLGDAFRQSGRAKEAQQAYAEAARLAEAALSVNPRNPATLSSLALYFAKGGNDGAAQSRLNEALQLAPTDVQVLYRAAAIHALAGRRTQALASLGGALERGYNRQTAAEDDDFAGLRSDPAFTSLVEIGRK
jgi:Flp pilus assembly protein TadD